MIKCTNISTATSFASPRAQYVNQFQSVTCWLQTPSCYFHHEFLFAISCITLRPDATLAYVHRNCIKKHSSANNLSLPTAPAVLYSAHSITKSEVLSWYNKWSCYAVHRWHWCVPSACLCPRILLTRSSSTLSRTVALFNC